jgi:DNA-directed RNA polymerase subunit beta'
MKSNIKIKERTVDAFDSVVLKLASPERIREWSFGEVTKPETMNYRTQRSEKNGLFDEKIFGPERDFECYCGKYKGIRYKGIVCEKCGVELTRSIVRRERMGHIELCVPVTHIWYLRTLPSRVAQVLGMNAGEVEKVIYFAGYLVTKVNEDEKARLLRELDGEYKNKVRTLQDEKTKEALTELLMDAKRDIESIQVGKVLDEVNYHKFSLKYGSSFEAGIGAEAVFNIFKHLDVKKLLADLEALTEKAGAAEKDKLNRRISVVKSLANANVRPEWMFITALPVIPAGLRPMVALEGGRHATSDVNDLYRRVINRNNRLRKLREINAPDVILRNEKRILQEAVDALIDNSIRHGSGGGAFASVSAAQRRPLKSIADNLKGKRGLFRQNLLGKRVDYSGRSVIVVGPELNLNQCGLPKHMALELFRPFVISELLKREMAFNIRGASRLVEEGIPEVWAILEQVIENKYVLLNRAPTLHRLSIQAFQPVLTEGNAIQVHPLVCSPFNADFDGDTMAVHVPLSEEAQMEAREILQSSKNILKPGSGEPTVTNKMLDIVLGTYWMTKIVEGERGEGKAFSSPEEAIQAQNFDVITYRSGIKVLAPDTEKYKAFAGGVFETSVGRILFNNLLPDTYPFINKEVNKSLMSAIVDEIINTNGIDQVPDLIDRIKDFGFKYVTKSGVTWSINDIVIPEAKTSIIENAEKKAKAVQLDHSEGLLADDEKTRKVIGIWQDAKADVEVEVAKTLDKKGPVFDMITSGARGSMGNITQMVGMKCMIQNAQGETIELPIISSFKEGLTPIEYFITTHGVRKGMTDTALNTAKAGYLTRRLFVVAQDVMITEDDCGTKEGISVTHKTASGIAQSYVKSAAGRVLSKDVVSNGEVLFKRGHLLSKEDALVLENEHVAELFVRSPLTCKTDLGICTQCYGLDLAKGKITDLGEAVGTVAAQAIGEPGTQLTMRTFHAGGVAVVGGDITAGLPRVEELFEMRAPKNPAVVSKCDGVISEIKENGKERIIKVIPDVPVKGKKVSEFEYVFHYPRIPTVRLNQHVSKGDILTDGHADIDELYKYGGQTIAQEYIISEVKKIYELQGDNLSRKHIEVIVRQMFSRVKIKEAGETPFAVGDQVEAVELEFENRKIRAKSGIEGKGDAVVMGITEASLARRSVLSAASFQHTNRMLIAASLKAQTDPLYGIMENVIIGRLIPAGTGFKGSPKNQMIQDLQDRVISEEEL